MPTSLEKAPPPSPSPIKKKELDFDDYSIESLEDCRYELCDAYHTPEDCNKLLRHFYGTDEWPSDYSDSD